METITIFFILVAGTFLTGLFFFIRSLILKRNIGCGLTGFMVIIYIGLFVYTFWPDMDYQSDEVYKDNFERWAGQPFPPSGKIIEKKHEGGFVDFLDVAIIEMDTLDYDRLLFAIQNNRSICLDTIDICTYSSPLNLFQMSASEFKFALAINFETELWFHENRRTVVYEIRNN
jgi:hypothetical protein